MITYFFALLVSVITGKEQANLVEWNATRKLTWEDFKAAPDPASTNAALTSSSINVEFGYDDQELQFTIKCRFDKNKSWVRVRNNEILAHEQGHFDMAELHARRLNKALNGYKFNSKTVSEDVNRIYDSVMTLHHAAQSEYDKETDFSRNKEKQAIWQKKITDDIQQLKAFANYSKK
jgi:predicted secreted Zn-dependent protease